MDKSKDETRTLIEGMPIFDTHEHFLPPEFIAAGNNRLIRIFRNSYVALDCVAAGLDRNYLTPASVVLDNTSLAKANDIDLDEWDVILPYLERTRFTSYYSSFKLGMEKLYHFTDKFTSANLKSLGTSVDTAYDGENWFETAMDKLGIQKILWDPYFSIHDAKVWSRRIIPFYNVDEFLYNPFLHPQGGLSAAGIAQAWDLEMETLDDLICLIDAGFERYRKLGAGGVKIAIAYRRTLSFEPTTIQEADAAFKDMQTGVNKTHSLALGNYLVRHVLARCRDYGYPIQFHTGMNYGHLEWTNPIHIVNLIQEFPEVKFVLFHGGYPYLDEIGLMGKSFCNVFLDLCWVPLLSESMAIGALARWLDLVPYTKFTWGGDVATVEECAGSATLFRNILSEVLANKLNAGAIMRSDAIDIASHIMYQNAGELYNIPD